MTHPHIIAGGTQLPLPAVQSWELQVRDSADLPVIITARVSTSGDRPPHIQHLDTATVSLPMAADQARDLYRQLGAVARRFGWAEE